MDFLKEKLRESGRTYFFNRIDEQRIEMISAAWMNDGENSRHRFVDIEKYLPGARRVLDMGSGCGTFVFYGLLNGYDAYGLDCEPWKTEFLGMKAEEHRYPGEWLERFCFGVGERLPFRESSFDCVSTYQTLEHVQDVRDCLSEMVRVTRPGGGIHIRCPDYRTTYEGHYLLPWLPRFPRGIARWYLRLLNRPTAGLDSIQYVTLPAIKKMLREVSAHNGKRLTVVDLDRDRFEARLAARGIPSLPLYPLYKSLLYLQSAFRRELSVNLFVYVQDARGGAPTAT